MPNSIYEDGSVAVEVPVISVEDIDKGSKLGQYFTTLEGFGLDTKPLFVRLSTEPNLDVIGVIIHMREYFESIMRAIQLKTGNIPAIHVHPQRDLSTTSLEFAESFVQGNTAVTLEELEDFQLMISDYRDNAAVVIDFIHRQSLQ